MINDEKYRMQGGENVDPKDIEIDIEINSTALWVSYKGYMYMGI